MKWEELTASDFQQSVPLCGRVCLLPIGVLEKHGDALPLGQDAIYAHEVSVRAAESEPAMVFPQYVFGQIAEARQQPGTVAIRAELLFALLENLCDEIARNGLNRIILVSGHGGNGGLLSFFLRSLLEKNKPYLVFQYFAMDAAGIRPGVLASQNDGHAGEYELSIMMALRPELVKDGGMPADYGLPLGRLAAFRQCKLGTPVDWYADHPGHLAADRVPGTAEKGCIIMDYEANRLAEAIRLVKADDTPLRLYREYCDRAVRPNANDGVVSEA